MSLANTPANNRLPDLTPEQAAQVMALRSTNRKICNQYANVSPRVIAKKMGVSEKQVRRALGLPTYHKTPTKQKLPPLTAEQVAEAHRLRNTASIYEICEPVGVRTISRTLGIPEGPIYRFLGVQPYWKTGKKKPAKKKVRQVLVYHGDTSPIERRSLVKTSNKFLALLSAERRVSV